MQSESTDLEKSLLKQLECPVCSKYMCPPIILCANGHNICNICRQKVSQCPKCLKQFVDSRNLALEGLARQVMYPCKYQSYGCTEISEHDNIVGHQATCRYNQQVCPVAKLAVGTCSWTGSYNDIMGHLQENHLEVCCEYVEGEVQFMYNVTGDMKFFCFIFAYNDVFFFLFQEKDAGGYDAPYNVFYAVLVNVGSSENAAKYKYKVEFVNKDDTEGVTFMHLTRSSDVNLEELYNSCKCGKLRSDVVSRLKDEEGNLKFKLEIIKIGN